MGSKKSMKIAREMIFMKACGCMTTLEKKKEIKKRNSPVVYFCSFTTKNDNKYPCNIFIILFFDVQPHVLKCF